MSDKEWKIFNREVEKIVERQGILPVCLTCGRPILKYRVILRSINRVVFQFQCGNSHKWQDDKSREW